MLPNTTRKISIAWFKQNSGSYALKGITIEENGHSYDSSVTFRDSDAKWVTQALGAEADVEYPGYQSSNQTPSDYPAWARESEPAAQRSREDSLDVERAGASLLRFRLGQLIQACDSDFVGTDLTKEINEAKSALLATDAGTHYEIAQAKAALSLAKRRKP